MRQSIWFSSFIFLFLVACTQKHIVFEAMQPNPVKGSIVYVYRSSVIANAITSPALLLNGELVSEIKRDSYLYRYVVPGRYILSLDLGERYEGNKRIDLDVKSNQVYFIRVTSELRFEMNKPYTRSFNLELVDSSIALDELAGISNGRESLSSFRKNKDQEEASGEKIEDAQFSIESTRNPFSK